MSSCIFCKIIAGEIPCIKLAENARAFSFLDISPLSLGHALVIPKFCAKKYHELPPEHCADTAILMNQVAKAMNATNYNILQNNGRLAHQVVDHVHFHIIPKNNQHDGLGISWNTLGGGRGGGGESVGPSKEELQKIATEIAERIVQNAKQ